jgi:hypothetical protein
MSGFFARRHLDTLVGCAPGALRHMMQALEATAGEVREIIGSVDVPFLACMA